MAVDGSLKFDTKIQTEGFEEGTATLKKAIDRLTQAVNRLSSNLLQAFNGAGDAATVAADKTDAVSEKMEKTAEATKEAARETEELKKQMEEIPIDRGFQATDPAPEVERRDPINNASMYGYDKTVEDFINNYDSDISEAEKHTNEFKQEIGSLSAKLKELEKQGMYFGDDQYDETYMKLAKVKQALADYKKEMLSPTPDAVSFPADSLQGEIDQLKKKLSDLSLQGKTFGDGLYDSTYQALNKAQAALNVYKQNLTQPASIPVTLDQNSFEAQKQRLMQEIKSMESQGITLGDPGYDERYVELQRVIQAEQEYKRSLLGTDQGQKKVKKSTDALNRSLNKTAKTSGKAQKGMTMLGMLGRSVLFSMVFKAIAAVGKALSEGYKNLAQYSSGFNKTASSLKSSMTLLKNSIITAFAPIIQVAVPFLNALISKISEALSWVAQFTARLFGNATTFTKAKKVQEDYAASLKKTGKEANKASGSLASFDKMEKLTENKGSDTAAGEVSPSQMFEEVEIDPKINESVEKLKKMLQPTIEAIGRLKAALEPLKNFALQGMLDFYNLFLVPVGNWVLGEGLPRFIDALANGLAAIDWERLNGALARLWEVLAPFAINVGEGLLWLWENVLVPLGTWTINEVVPLFLDMLSTAIDILNKVAEAFRPAWDFLWNEFIKPLGEWTGGIIVDVLGWVNDKLKILSDWISDHQEELTQFIEILGMIALGFGSVKGGISLVNAILPALKNGIGAISKFIMGPVGIVAALAAIVIAAGNGAEMLDTLKGIFGNILDFVKNVFTGQWGKAWENIKNVFKGVFNAIIIILESAANLIVRGLNKLSFTTPDWLPFGLGNKKFGFDLKEISLPRLASGTVVPPRAGEFAAILGDNRRETEVVSPLSTMKQAFKEAMAESGGTKGTIHLNVYLDGRTVYENVVRWNDRNTEATGKNALAGA